MKFPNTLRVCTGGDSPSPHTPKGCQQRRSLPPRRRLETPTPWPTHRLPSRNSFLDSTEALNTSTQDARTTLWVEEWNALGERSNGWRDIPNEHLASGTDEPWSTWRSLNRLRVQKGRCRAIMKMWKLSHTDVCDWGVTDYVSSYDTW